MDQNEIVIHKLMYRVSRDQEKVHGKVCTVYFPLAQ